MNETERTILVMKSETERKVLLVEDEPRDVELTLRAFKKNYIANEIVVVNDGVAAMEYLQGTGAHAGRDPKDMPAVVLLDLKLPKLDGLEVLRRVRADPVIHRVPIVLLTSSSEEQDKIKGYDLGANSYIRKPVNFADFQEAVRQLGVYWLVLNETPPK